MYLADILEQLYIVFTLKHAILEPRIGHFASEVFHFSEVTASPLYHRVQQTKARTSDLSTDCIASGLLYQGLITEKNRC